MQRWQATAVGLILGFAADALLGDPRRGHPTAAFGRLAAAAEQRMWADSRRAGLAHTVGLAGGTALLGRAISRGVRGRPRATVAVTAAATWSVLGARSLAAEAHAMQDFLTRGDVDAARARLPHLCGRDPAYLDETGLARATIESVAENTSDAVVAPLLWGGAFGVPGLLTYRAINTLDAMVGHRTLRHAQFGCVAARLDDLANWLPARVTGVLTALAAPSVGGSIRVAWRVLWRDGGRHPSPNAGRCEAAAAGALGIRLGGVNVYGGRIERRPDLGDGRPPVPADIARAVRLSRLVGAAAAALTALAAARRSAGDARA